MADVTIGQLNSLTPSTGLVLPVSNGSTTGKVTLAEVCGVMTSTQIVNALGYTPISKAIDLLDNTTFPVGGNISIFTRNLNLTNYSLIYIIIKNLKFTLANTRMGVVDYDTSVITVNTASTNNGVWAYCNMNLDSGVLISTSEINSNITDNGTGHQYCKSHNYTRQSPSISFYSTSSTNYFNGGTLQIYGVRG